MMQLVRILIGVALANGVSYGQAPSASTHDHAAGLIHLVPMVEISAMRDRVDTLVGQQLADRGEKPNAAIDDETFLRRVYLDVIGRIPTLEEARSFLANPSTNKRATLIDELLESPGYASHYFHFWADILRIQSRLTGRNPGMPYIRFVKESLRTNKPYDEFVREMLVSEGPILQRDNGAVGYFLRDVGMPEDNMANTVRIFLGTRLECAQCHDHPFDKWTQRQFFEMVAFQGGVRTRIDPNDNPITKELQEFSRSRELGEPMRQAIRRVMRPMLFQVSGGGTGLARLPDSYQYDDGKPNEIVVAKALFDDEPMVVPEIPVSRERRRNPHPKPTGRLATQVPGATDIGSRVTFANWLTSPENPRFTTVIANRLWKRLFGLGLIEPVDDFTDDTVASNPALMVYLTEMMVDLDYDMKQYLRVLLNTKSYQRSARSEDLLDPAAYNFPGPLLRRMTAEQLWDSLLTLAIPNIDLRLDPHQNDADGSGVSLDWLEQIEHLSAKEIVNLAQQHMAETAKPYRGRKQMQEQLAGMEENSVFATDSEEIQRDIRRLRKQLDVANRTRDNEARRTLRQELERLRELRRNLPGNFGPDLVRASELSSPAPPGHFVREFGQSDREQIENASVDPAVTQALSMMNGEIEKRIISNRRTVLMRNVITARPVPEKVDAVFMSMLSRMPDRRERAMWVDAAEREGNEALSDLIWTLANCSEFLFVR